MKLSERTLKLLKNYAGINQSIYIRAGNMLSTVSIAKNIYSETKIEEEFPVSFAIYDLTELLNTLKLFNSPILDFSDAENNYMYICEENDKNFKVRYVFAPLKQIVYPEKRPNLGITDVNFKLSNDTLSSIMKASNVMQLPNMVITPIDSNSVNINVTDIKDNSSNKFSISVDANVEAVSDFNLIFNMDTFKMIPQDYDIGISNGRLSSWYNDDVDYVIALDIKSEYNG
jgi:hypothetical protein